MREGGVGPELAHVLRAHELVRHDGGDLRGRPVREAPGGPGGRSSRDGSDGAGGRKHGETLTHLPLIGRDHGEHYPPLVATTHITPEPNESERKAILAALAADEVQEQVVSEWAAALLPVREETESDP